MIYISDPLLGPDGNPDYEDGAFVEITMPWRRVDATTTGTDKTLTIPIISPGGLLTPDLQPGPAVIRIKLGELRVSSTYKVVVPSGTGSRSLFDLIAPGVEIPESTPAAVIAQIVTDFLAANPPGPAVQPLEPHPTRAGFFTIPDGSSITEDPARPGVFLIGA